MNEREKTRLIYTIVLFISSFLSGLCWNSFFSTMIDFTEIMNATVKEVSLGLTVRSLGSCVGALGGSLLYDRYDNKLVYSITLSTMGICLISISNTVNLFMHQLLNLIIGVSVGITDVGTGVTTFHLWEDKSLPILQSISFIWAGGSAIVPLILNPFLSVPKTSENVNEHQYLLPSKTINSSLPEISLATNTKHLTEKINDLQIEHHPSRIWIPFTAIGIAIIMLALVIFTHSIHSILKKNKESVDENQISTLTVLENDLNLSKTTEKQSSLDSVNFSSSDTIMKKLIVLFASLLLFLYCGYSDSAWQFWVVFITKISDLSKESAVYMLSSMSIAYACSNFVGIFIAVKLKPFTMLILLTSLQFLGNFIHLIFAPLKSNTFIWIGALMGSVGMGCYYPSSFAYVGETIGMTNTIASFLVSASLLANAIGYCLLIGYLIEQWPMILIYSNLASVLMNFIFLFFLYFFNHRLKLSTKKFLEKSNNELK